jgi:hypothetical protein
MIEKLKFIKLFENFNKDYFDKLIENDKTYIDKKEFQKNINSNIINIEKYKIISDKIRKYDITNFSVSFTYCLIIKPDVDFIELIKELNEILINKITLDIEFEFSIFIALINRIDFKGGIPNELKNMRLGYKLYKMIINKYKYITSKIGVSDDAKKIWYYLMQDSDLLCFTSNNISGVILKSCNDSEIKEFLDKLKGYKDLEFDDELKQRIIEFYDDLDYYKKLED